MKVTQDGDSYKLKYELNDIGIRISKSNLKSKKRPLKLGKRNKLTGTVSRELIQ